MKRLALMLRVVGGILMLFSAITLLPLVVNLWYAENYGFPFLMTSGITFGAGLLLRLIPANGGTLRLRDGFAIVTMLWLLLSLFGAIPFYASGLNYTADAGASYIGAWFESMSGLTTTGATVYSGLDNFPKAILFYRHLLQWFGGLGIVVLAIAVLPMLGVGGMQLYRIESSGPYSEGKLTPRIAETAKILWGIYTALTVVCAGAYHIAGMSVFDAICHSMSTVSIGGFSTHDANMAYFDSVAIEAVAVIFMLISGINYSLHFLAWRRRHFGIYRDTEVRVFFTLIALATVSVLLHLLFGEQRGVENAVRSGIFQAVSITTTTGFTNDNFAGWSGGIPMFLILMSAIGSCAGSTGGGVKVMRFWLLAKQTQRELFRLVHPNAERPIKIGHKTVEENILNGVWGFFSAYALILVAGTLLLLNGGLDAVSAFSAVAASLHNLGPGLGLVADNYAAVGDISKIILCIIMLLGRLEIFTLLVVLTPTFWRQ